MSRSHTKPECPSTSDPSYGQGSKQLPLAPQLGASGVADRVLSLDQFRGYTILGMILVNFIGHFDKIHGFFKHNDNYFSYADSIMPAFHLAVGFSYRLTMLRRMADITVSKWAIWWGYLKRSLTLVFICAIFFGIGANFKTWSQFSEMPGVSRQVSSPIDISMGSGELGSPDQPFSKTFVAQWRHLLAAALKSQLWNTLAIIGVTQIVILPFVASSFRIRILAMVGFGLGHALLTLWFNWGFVVGDPENWMVRWWGTGTLRSWDGGFFGPLSWAIVMLSGTLAYDIVSSHTSRQAAAKLLVTGAVLMSLAWGLSCMSRLYDLDKGAVPAKFRPENALSPIVPSMVNTSHTTIGSFLSEPPFVQPPGTKVQPTRLRNYWMMIKQFPTLTFMLCATGFGMLVYGLFVWLCDVRGWWSSLLNTFGTNALAAYILHYSIMNHVNQLVPRDAPIWYVMLGFLLFFFITWCVVRYLEKRKVFIRI